MQPQSQTPDLADAKTSPHRWEFRLAIVLALLCAALLGAQRLQYSDDAYITFRHVKNIVLHSRPAWNLSGDPVMGSTSPAFVLVLSVFCKMVGTVQIDHAAFCLNVVFHFLTILLLYWIAKDWLRRSLPAALVTILVGVNSVSLYVHSQGFESAMLVMVLTGALYCVRTGRDGWAVGLASVAPLVRPEGIILTPLVWGYILTKKRFKNKLLPAYALIPLAWVLFSTTYYGSPIPHSIVAKKHFPKSHRPYVNEEVHLAARLPVSLSGAADLWKQSAGPQLLTGRDRDDKQSVLHLWRGRIMLLGLPLAIIVLAIKRDGRVIYVLYAPLFLLFYGWLGHTKPWYFPSFVAISLLFLFGGWVLAIDWAADRWATGHGEWVRRCKIVPMVNIVLFIIFLSANPYMINRGEDRHATRGLFFPPDPQGDLWHLWGAQRYNRYREVAEYVNGLDPTPRVAMISEVGFFGYFYEGEVIDTVGLCSPEALPFYPPPKWDIQDDDGQYHTMANNFTPTNMVMALLPDYLINSRYFVKNLLLPESPFSHDYEEIARGRAVYSEPILIFRRRSPVTGGATPTGR